MIVLDTNGVTIRTGKEAKVGEKSETIKGFYMYKNNLK